MSWGFKNKFLYTKRTKEKKKKISSKKATKNDNNNNNYPWAMCEHKVVPNAFMDNYFIG